MCQVAPGLTRVPGATKYSAWRTLQTSMQEITSGDPQGNPYMTRQMLEQHTNRIGTS